MTSVRLASTIVAISVVVSGIALWISPEARLAFAPLVQMAKGGESKQPTERGHEHRPPGTIKLTTDQIAKTRIELAAVGGCTITQQVTAPGTVTLDPDRIGRVAAKVVGTVAELRKRLGDPVERNELVAVIESREVADAKSEYLATRVTDELRQTLFERAASLWQGKVMTENDYLRARATALDARVKFDAARQKLFTLGLSEEQIAALPSQPPASLRLQEVRAPIGGQIIERRVELGAPVGREGQESEIYVIADLAALWTDLSVPTSELVHIAVGQAVAVTAGQAGLRAQAKVIFVSPLLQADTRSARVIAAMDNPSMAWRPGVFVTAQIAIAEQRVDVCVPQAALQTIEGEQNVFVRTDEGFEKREVVIGRGDDSRVEIVFGLDPGEVIATTRTFVLKAELGKGEADHDDH
jgi:cobalt-zinc-cadmium efflux system membrane fusion protein